MAMTARSPRRKRPPLDERSLEEAALRYAGRYATTRAKLAFYLARKVRERGWDGAADPAIERLVGRMAELGYVDDRAFARAKAGSLAGRGYGDRRVAQALRAAGVSDEDGAAARETGEGAALETALRLARRRRIGPYAETRPDRPGREKAIAALLRAGHSIEIARRIVDCPPGHIPEPDSP